MLNLSADELLEVFEETEDLMKADPANNLNFCQIDGMAALLQLIIGHKDDQVRKAACALFNSTTCGNAKVKDFAYKLGAVNLAV